MNPPIKKSGMSGGKIALIVMVVIICAGGIVLLWGWLFGKWFKPKHSPSTKPPQNDAETLLQLRKQKQMLQSEIQQLLFKYPCLETSLSCRKSIDTLVPSTTPPSTTPPSTTPPGTTPPQHACPAHPVPHRPPTRPPTRQPSSLLRE